jgi:hypothetical protein
MMTSISLTYVGTRRAAPASSSTILQQLSQQPANAPAAPAAPGAATAPPAVTPGSSAPADGTPPTNGPPVNK